MKNYLVNYKNAVVLERVGEGRIKLELIKKRKRNCLGLWLRRNCLLKDVVKGMVNGKKFAAKENISFLSRIFRNIAKIRDKITVVFHL